MLFIYPKASFSRDATWRASARTTRRRRRRSPSRRAAESRRRSTRPSRCGRPPRWRPQTCCRRTSGRRSFGWTCRRWRRATRTRRRRATSGPLKSLPPKTRVSFEVAKLVRFGAAGKVFRQSRNTPTYPGERLTKLQLVLAFILNFLNYPCMNFPLNVSKYFLTHSRVF